MDDVVIAGGGVAGSTLAILLGRAGLRVALFERARFPREKPCGEGLMPGGVAVLERLGLAAAVGGAPFYGVRYYAGELCAEGRFPTAPGAAALGYGQRRLHLDRVLFEAAAATPGVTARSGVLVEAPVAEHGRVVGVVIAGSVHRAPIVVAADGLHSRLRRHAGLEGRAGRRQRIGVRVHFRLPAGSAQPPWVEVFLGRGYELYVTPLPNGEVLVAGLAERTLMREPPPAALRTWLRDQPILWARLAGAPQISRLSGMFPLAARPRAGGVPGMVLLGDAAGFIDPITGGGMTQALQTAELLATHIIRAGPDPDWLPAYDRERQRMLRDYRLLTQAVLTLAAAPWLARQSLRLLRQAPTLFSHFIGVAGGVRPLLGRGATGLVLAGLRR